MTCRPSLPHRLALPAALLALPLALPLIWAAPAFAQQPAPDRCSTTVSVALGTWDTGLAAAERFGDRAVAIAREKGREYLLPLLGIDPKTAQPNGDTANDLGRAVEESRDDPKRRAELCAAITRAADEARANVGAGWESLKRALDDWRLTPGAPDAAPPATPPGDGRGPDGLIRT